MYNGYMIFDVFYIKLIVKWNKQKMDIEYTIYLVKYMYLVAISVYSRYESSWN